MKKSDIWLDKCPFGCETTRQEFIEDEESDALERCKTRNCPMRKPVPDSMRHYYEGK